MASTLNPNQNVAIAAAVAASKSISFGTSPTNSLYASVNADDAPLVFLTPQQEAVAAGQTLLVIPATGIMPCAQLSAA
jgi:hypothetical protein